MTAERKVFRSLEEAAGRFGPCSVAIGNFDGVHVGHQALIRAALSEGEKIGSTPAVLTFDPHPASIVAPEREPEFVSTLQERIALLGEAGARNVLILPFTRELSRLTPEDFVRKILVDSLGAKAVVVGDTFRFGHKQAGDAGTLSELGKRLGFVPHFLHPVTVRGEVVSSSAVRGHVAAGQVARAGRLLGRCFSVTGPVVSGQGIGRKQTVPTLNIRPVPGQVLPKGVFVTETVAGSRVWPSITNVGLRPTFGGDEVVIETYLLEALADEWPAAIEVRFRRFLRAEERFDSADELKSQILRDVRRAQAYWRRTAKFVI